MPDSYAQTTSVLFVCLGNICRSPLAEGIFLSRVEEAGVENRYRVDSAGTGAWHVGEPPDPRSVEVARRRGIELPGRARQVVAADFGRFDWIVAMDRSNLSALETMMAAQPGEAELVLLRDFDPDPDDGEVPDPYYGGSGGFEEVFDLVHRSIERLFQQLESDASRSSAGGP